MNHGLCECGCGQLTAIAQWTNTAKGWVRGEPKRFVNGHQSPCGPDNHNWRGGLVVDQDGYIRERVAAESYKLAHHSVAERALGRPIPSGVVVHHVNEDRQDNRPGNLVICQDQSYHQLIHRRSRALRACGHAGWLLCRFCKQYEDPANMHVSRARPWQAHHRECEARNQRERRRRRAKEKAQTPQARGSRPTGDPQGSLLGGGHAPVGDGTTYREESA